MLAYLGTVTVTPPLDAATREEVLAECEGEPRRGSFRFTPQGDRLEWDGGHQPRYHLELLHAALARRGARLRAYCPYCDYEEEPNDGMLVADDEGVYASEYRWAPFASFAVWALEHEPARATDIISWCISAALSAGADETLLAEALLPVAQVPAVRVPLIESIAHRPGASRRLAVVLAFAGGLDDLSARTARAIVDALLDGGPELDSDLGALELDLRHLRAVPDLSAIVSARAREIVAKDPLGILTWPELAPLVSWTELRELLPPQAATRWFEDEQARDDELTLVLIERLIEIEDEAVVFWAHEVGRAIRLDGPSEIARLLAERPATEATLRGASVLADCKLDLARDRGARSVWQVRCEAWLRERTEEAWERAGIVAAVLIDRGVAPSAFAPTVRAGSPELRRSFGEGLTGGLPLDAPWPEELAAAR